MEILNQTDRQVFKKGIASITFHLFATVIIAVLVIFNLTNIINNPAIFKRYYDIGIGVPVGYPIVFLIIIVFSAFVFIFYWLHSVQVYTRFEVDKTGLTIYSLIPGIKIKGREIPFESGLIPWGNLKKITLEIGKSSDLYIDTTGTKRIYIPFALEMYPLAKIFAAISKHVPMSKFNPEAKKLFVKKYDLKKSNQDITPDQVDIMTLRQIYRIPAAMRSKPKVKKIIFYKYLNDAALIEPENAREVMELGMDLLKNSPDDPELLKAIGNIYLWMAEDFENALVYYNKYRLATEEDGLIYKKLFQCLLKTEKFEKAKELMQTYERLNLKGITKKEKVLIEECVARKMVAEDKEYDIDILGSYDRPEE